MISLPATDRRLQDIRFVTSADGTRLAVRITGSGGPPLVLVKSHDFPDPEYSPATQHWIDVLAADRMLVRYDVRGIGMSECDEDRLSHDAYVDDVDAVVDAIGSAPVDLLAVTHGSLDAIGYATRRPERVRRLVVCGGHVRGRLKRDPTAEQILEAEAIVRSIEIGWGTRTDYAAHFRLATIGRMFPDWPMQQLQLFDRLHPYVSGPRLVARVRAMLRVDEREAATRIACPTLVCHSRENRYVPFEEGRLLASLVPNAKFLPLDGGNAFPVEGEPAWPHFLAELRAFLGAGDGQRETGMSVEPIHLREALTPRQLEVLRLVAQGHTDKQVGRRLNLSPRTVEMHVARAVATLRCHSRTEAVRRASQLRLLD